MRIHLVDNKEKVKAIQSAIKENDGYCPCKLERTQHTKCICTEFLTQENSGECKCGLYYKEI